MVVLERDLTKKRKSSQVEYCEKNLIRGLFTKIQARCKETTEGTTVLGLEGLGREPFLEPEKKLHRKAFHTGSAPLFDR